MSIAAVSSTVSYSRAAASSQQLREMHDSQALTAAIQKGDIQGIMRAYAAWQQDVKADKAASQRTPKQAQAAPRVASSETTKAASSDKPANPAVQALAKAVQSGDVTSIQTAFAALQKGIKGLGQNKSGANGSEVSDKSGTSASSGSSFSGINSQAVINSIASTSIDTAPESSDNQTQSSATASSETASAPSESNSGAASSAPEPTDSFVLDTLS